MYITRLELRDFRNYEEAELVPCEGINVLYGDNAQGKTALLEAVVLCCTGRSHRTSKDRELIRWGQPFGRVELQAMRADGTHEIEIILPQAERKTVKVGGSVLTRSGELMGHVNGVLFAPEDLRMVKDGPAERRRFIDMEISQTSPAYYYALQRYNRALNQRNRLLKDALATPSLLDMLGSWDEQLCSAGAFIMDRRRAFIERLSRFAGENHREITGGRERLECRYCPSAPLDETGEALERALGEALLRAREQDERRCMTSVGPHRDDLQLTLDGMDVRAYGSQGQQRTSALSLKLAELTIMKEATGEWPVLLLDDVMSELDPGRRRQLLSRLRGIQTLVTCTDLTDLAEADVGAAWRVTSGALETEGTIERRPF